MHTIDLEIESGKKSYKAIFSIASNWNEVSAMVYPELCSLYLKTPVDMSAYDKTVRAFILLTLDHYEIVKKLKGQEVYHLLKTVDWVFNRLDLQVNLLPKINIDGIDYFGPSNEMENLRFGEFCLADTHYVKYARYGQIVDLHRLAACLYRPAGLGNEYSFDSPTYRGDIREKFNDQLLNLRTKSMQNLSKAILDGIYIFYASCKHNIVGMYTEFFPPIVPGNTQPVKDQNFSWFDIYDDLRGDPKFGGAEKLEDEFLHTVLASIERSKKTMKEIKSKHKI